MDKSQKGGKGCGARHASAVIAAAGKGTRMRMDVNKQYIEVQGIPVLALTLRKFEECSLIDEIVVVANKDEIDYCKKNIIDRFGFRKIRKVTAGGDSRQRSVYNGLNEVSPDSNIVLIHDGARPFFNNESIISCIDAADSYGAACVAVPVKDTVKLADQDGFVGRTIDRNGLWQIQTPQAFEYGLIIDAHRKAEADSYMGTDDAMLAERAGHRVKIVMGGYYNIKITTTEDLVFAEAICSLKGKEI